MDYITNKGIYKITCTANGKFYIGSSVNLKRRHYGHFHELQTNTHSNKHLQSAYNKYGSETFIFEIIEVLPETIEHKEALIIEQKYLDELNPCDRNIGFNMCKEAGSPRSCEKYVCSEETKQLMSKNRKGKPKSEKFKQIMSELTKGKTMKERTNNPDWTCNKKGKSMKEITGDPNWTDSRIGRKHSQEAIDKMSKSKSGENNPMFGRKFKRDPKTIRRGPDHPCYGKPGRRGADNHSFGKTGELSPRFNPEKITLVNKQGEILSQTRYDWKQMTVDINALLNGSQKSSKGWSIPS